MADFFYIEGGYLILALIILRVTLFVTTRPFMRAGALKKGMIGVFSVLALFVGTHYYITAARMQKVQGAFEAGQKIICENRMVRKGAQSLVIEKSRGWELQENNFVSPAYSRSFFTARCVVYAR